MSTIKSVQMQSIKIENLPDFLQTSELCKNLDQGNKTISIPMKFCLPSSIVTKPQLQIKNQEGFINLLHVIRYWMVNDIPNEIYKYVEKNYRSLPYTWEGKETKDYTKDLNDSVDNFSDLCLINEFQILVDKPLSLVSSCEFQVGSVVKDVQNYEYDEIIDYLKKAIENKYINLIKYLCSKCDMYKLIVYMYGKLGVNSESPFDNMILMAISSNETQILKTIHDHFRINYIKDSKQIFLPRSTLEKALVWNTSIEMIKYLHELAKVYSFQDYRVDKMCLFKPCLNNNMDVIEYCFTNKDIIGGNYKSLYRHYSGENHLSIAAAMKNNVKLMQYLYEKKEPITPIVAALCSKHNSLECL